MKKKIKNKELEEILSSAAHLGTYPMPGELTLAIIGIRKELKVAFENYTEACRQIGEARCERGKDGMPITEFQKDDQGNELINAAKKMKFKDGATEAAALKELKNLGEKEIEFETKEINGHVIAGLNNITPIQMEAILAFIEITY